MRGLRLLCAGALLALLMAGCGGAGKQESTETRPAASTTEKSATTTADKSKAPLTEVSVSLDGYMGAENVGFLMAQKRGFFEDVGLDVWVGAPLRPRRPTQYVSEQLDEIGVIQEPQVAFTRGTGMPLVAIGSVISEPTEAMMWLPKSGIHSIADLEGKTIAVPGVPFQEGFLQSVLAEAGLTLDDVRITTVNFNIAPVLLKGIADAAFGGTWNIDGIELEARGAKPVITPVQDLGLPDYEELMVFTRADFMAKDPGMIHDFMSAVERGNAAAAEDPEAAIKLIEGSLEPDPATSRKALRAQVEATLPLLSTDGEMDSDRAQGLVEWMDEEGMIKKEFPADTLLSDE